MTSPRTPCGLPIRPTTTSSACSVGLEPVETTAAPFLGDARCSPEGRHAVLRRSCAQRRRSTSTKSIRAPPRPGEGRDDGAERGRRAAAATDHLAEVVGVDPDLEERAARSCLSRTATSSGLSTTPRTRCSRASASTVLRPRSSRPASRRPRPRLGTLGGLARARSGLAAVSAVPRPRRPARRAFSAVGRRRRSLGLGRLGLLRRPSWCRGPPLGSPCGVLEGLVEDVELVALGSLTLQGALGARQALEGLPVAGDLEDRRDGLGRLGADAEPVLRPVGDDVDVRRVLLGVVLADLLDDPAVALLARVDDDDAVLRDPDLAQALQTDLDGHVCGVSLTSRVVVGVPAPGGDTGGSVDSMAHRAG